MQRKKKTGKFDYMSPGKVGKTLNYVILLVVSLIILMPIWIMFIVSFKSIEEYVSNSVLTLPDSFLNFQNYIDVLKQANWLLAYKNTFFIMIISTVGNIILGTMMAYAIGRFDFKGKNLVKLLFLGATMIPSVTTQVTRFKVIQGMGLYNTIWSSVVIYLGTGIIQLYLFLQFIEQIPKEIDESARVDGASFFTIYYKLILPEMRPAIVTVAIIKMLEIYNDMYTPYLYMPSSKLKTVTTTLMQFSYDQSTIWTTMGAAVIFVMLPTMIIYVFLQKYIMAGIAEGSVKG